MSYPYLSDLVLDLTGLDLPLPIPMFGLFVAVAMLSASRWLQRRLDVLYAAGAIGPMRLPAKGGKAGQPVSPAEGVPELTVWVMLAGIVGARLFHILESLDEFAVDPWGMIFTTSGLSIFGGLIAGTAVGLAWALRRGLPLARLLDAAAPAMMLGYAIGRVGCQVSGDGDWGMRADLALKPDWLPLWAWAQTYVNNVVGTIIAPPGVYPTPLYEAAVAGLCFGLLYLLRNHGFRPGWLFAVYLLLAGAERLLIEQIRINPVLDFQIVRATQAEFISGVLIAAGLLWTMYASRPASAPVGAGSRPGSDLPNVYKN